MNIADFFKDARKRHRPPTVAVPASAPAEGTVAEAPISVEEENFFRAATGLRFYCGVCHKRHRSSKVENLKSLRACLRKIAQGFNGGFFKPNADQPTAVHFHYTPKSASMPGLPSNGLWTATHKSVVKEHEALMRQISDQVDREIVEVVSLTEVLGAPDTFAALRERFDKFNKEAAVKSESVIDEQRAITADFAKRIKGWRRMPFDKWTIKDRTFVENRKWATPTAFKLHDPLDNLKLNGAEHQGEWLMGSFRIPDLDGMIKHSHKQERSTKVPFDMDLWSDGFPAFSWGVEVFRGSTWRSRKVQSQLCFVTTWDGRTYMNPTGNVLMGDLKDEEARLPLLRLPRSMEAVEDGVEE